MTRSAITLFTLTLMAWASGVAAQEAASAEVITSSSQLLRGVQAAGQPGDLRLSDGECVYIFSAVDHPLYRSQTGGALIDVSRAETSFDLLGELRTAHGPRLSRSVRTTDVHPSEDGQAVIVEGVDSEEEDIAVRTEYRLDPDWPGLIVTTEVTNGTAASLEAWDIGDFAHWGPTTLFLMNAGVVYASGVVVRTPCTVAYGQDFSLAIVPPEGTRTEVVHHSEHTRLIHTGGDIPPGETLTCTRHLFVGLESMDTIADAIWAAQGLETGTLRGDVRDQVTGEGIAGAELLVNERGTPMLPMLRVLSDAEGHFEVSMPAGREVICIPRYYSRTRPTTTVPRTLIEAGGEAFQQCVLSPPARMDLEIRDEATGELLPVRVALYTHDGRPSELGPIESGVAGGPYLFVPEGRGVFEVPTGQYRMTISHGPEYESYQRDVIFISGRERRFHLTLERLIDSSGYVAADLGVLTSNSHSTMVSPIDRLRTAVCEGLEFLVATDSQVVTDLSATLEGEGVDFPVTVQMGERFNAPEGSGLGHWSIFPLPSDLAGQSVFGDGDFASSRDLLRSLRSRFPDALITCLDPLSPDSPFMARGYTRDEGSHRYTSLTPVSAEDMDFDLMEVFGDRDMDRLNLSLELYHSLLHEGYRIQSTGSANSHFAGLEEIGYPRTYVAADDSDPSSIDPQEVFDSLRAGNLFVTTGPFIEFTVEGHPMGSMFLWEMGEPVEVDLRVTCPVNIRLAYVDLCKQGLFAQRHAFLEPPSGMIYDYRPPEGRNRLMIRSDEVLSVEVGGASPIQPMNPFAEGARQLTHMAFTNPIWIDTDGNGHFNEFLYD
ncbi:CehA/McbA family metallohydrolase [Candidatus Sumerlaeota bacterium]|nr:CehA/McbA family metallohydrolase [Candidatus Sumerlaeota bacterium]